MGITMKKFFIMMTLIILASLGLVSAQVEIKPRQEECANMPSYMTSSDRIVGGQQAPSPVPFQVSVQDSEHYLELEHGTLHYCGATILDASTLLSAAHCFYNPNADLLGESPRLTAKNKTIRAGSLEKYSGGQVRNIAQIIWNDNPGFEYNPVGMENDFVILKLEYPLELNNDVQA